MTDYVLIHGAWHGSWCWARVRSLLAAKAHRVFAPTLTGRPRYGRWRWLEDPATAGTVLRG